MKPIRWQEQEYLYQETVCGCCGSELCFTRESFDEINRGVMFFESATKLDIPPEPWEYDINEIIQPDGTFLYIKSCLPGAHGPWDRDRDNDDNDD
jgi:hypothetical protein